MENGRNGALGGFRRGHGSRCLPYLDVGHHEKSVTNIHGIVSVNACCKRICPPGVIMGSPPGSVTSTAMLVSYFFELSILTGTSITSSNLVGSQITPTSLGSSDEIGRVTICLVP